MNNFDNVYWIETIFRGVIINIKLLKMKKSIKNLNTKTLPHLEASKICGGTNNQTDNEKLVHSRIKTLESDLDFLS